MIDYTILRKRYRDSFGHSGNTYFSPGRINLIGEHTDYNGGYVFPGAIDKGITAEISPNGSSLVRLLALDITDEPNYIEFELEESQKPIARWPNYIFGVCMELKKRAIPVTGFDAAFTGNVPLGAGMSSSAALECVFAFALNQMFAKGKMDKLELAKVGQAAEHNYCNVKCGIMDQFTSLFGKEDCLILLDCRSLEYEYFTFNPQGYRLTLLDSKVKHALGSEYNDRRQSCENAVYQIALRHKEIQTLRDVNYSMLNSVKDNLSPVDYRRAKYILDEKERVLAVRDALKKEDFVTVGKKMFETHNGLSKEFEISCPELDFLVEKGRELGVTGSRMMGGGFGGCSINLVEETLYNRFISITTQEFYDKFGHKPETYDINIKDGTRQI